MPITHILTNINKMKIIICKCKQCKAVKSRRHKNRRQVKRMLNKKRRQNKDEYFVWYWA